MLDSKRFQQIVNQFSTMFRYYNNVRLLEKRTLLGFAVCSRKIF